MMFGIILKLKQFLKSCKYLISLPNDEDISLSVSRKFSKHFEENFFNHKQKHNGSLKLWNEVNTKKLECFMVDIKQEPWYYSKPSSNCLKNSLTINI